MSLLFVRSILLAALVAGFCSAQAQAPVRPPIAHFFEPSQYNDPKLSPNAKFLAVRSAVPGKREGLAIVNLEDGSVTAAAGFADVDIDDFMWINNERLVFDTTNRRIDNGDLDRAPGLFGINRDGSGWGAGQNP